MLLIMKTCSIAIVGISSSRIRRNALTMDGSMPIKSNSMSSSVVLASRLTEATSTLKLCLKASPSHWLSIPRPRYASAEVTVLVCRHRGHHLSVTGARKLK